MASKSLHAPKPGRLEHNVDAVLLGRGLQLNSSVEKILVKSRRGKFVPFKKGQRPPGRKAKRGGARAKPARRPTPKKAARRKPSRGKQLRAARRKGPGK